MTVAKLESTTLLANKEAVKAASDRLWFAAFDTLRNDNPIADN